MSPFTLSVSSCGLIQTTQTRPPVSKGQLFPAIPTNPSRLEVPMKSKFSFLSLLLLVLFQPKHPSQPSLLSKSYAHAVRLACRR